MQGPIAVIGVTGNVGSRVAKQLVAKGVAVKGIARHTKDFKAPKGVELIEADMTDPKAAERVLAGIKAVYLTPPESGETPLALERKVAETVIKAAKKHNIAHLVVHTALHADKGDTGAHPIDNKHGIETQLARSGVPYTILRPGWFMQNLLISKDHLDDGRLSMPFAPSRKIGGVSAEDVAKAAVGFLEKGPQNRGFDLHVPGGITFEGLAKTASETSGRPVQFTTFKGPTREFVESYPISSKQKDMFAELFDHFARADALGRSEDVTQALPGFEYTQPKEFMKNELFAKK